MIPVKPPYYKRLWGYIKNPKSLIKYIDFAFYAKGELDIIYGFKFLFGMQWYRLKKEFKDKMKFRDGFYTKKKDFRIDTMDMILHGFILSIPNLLVIAVIGLIIYKIIC